MSSSRRPCERRLDLMLGRSLLHRLVEALPGVDIRLCADRSKRAGPDDMNWLSRKQHQQSRLGTADPGGILGRPARPGRARRSPSNRARRGCDHGARLPDRRPAQLSDRQPDARPGRSGSCRRLEEVKRPAHTDELPIDARVERGPVAERRRSQPDCRRSTFDQVIPAGVDQRRPRVRRQRPGARAFDPRPHPDESCSSRRLRRSSWPPTLLSKIEYDID